MDSSTDTRSATSSPLRELSRSPTPPAQWKAIPRQLPTPPSSQSSKLSSVGTCTPRSDLDIPSVAYSQDGDGSPPLKRRRLNGSSMPRTTQQLDLEDLGSRGTAPLPEQKVELDRLLKCLRKKRKIVVVAGAGISVSAGIPDFRSTEGLFKTLKDTHNLKGSGKQLFDASVYRDANSTSHFHDMVREMSTLSRTAKPTPFHHLVARLAHEGRLLRLYSQNIDGLEVSLPPLQTVAPLPSKGPWPKTVQVHGGLEKMVCTKCQHTSDFQPELFDGPVPPLCSICEELDLVRTEVAGKRSHGVGRLRPRMVLYNEHNPDQDSIGSVSNADLRTRPDAVIVVGTSCKIPGIRRIVREMCGVVRDRRDGLTVWINNDPVPTGKDLESCWDLVVKGTADEVADRAGLGHWDDPEIEVESVAEANVQAAKENNIQVVVESPKKATKHFDPITDALATAKAQAESEWEEEKAANVPALTLSSELTTALKMPPPTKGRPKAASKGKLKNPASQGMSIDMFLNQKVRGTATQVKQESVVPEAPATKPGTTKPTLAPTKKSATTKKATKPAAPRKSRAKPKTKQTADAAGSSTKLNFKVTKASATAKTASTAKQPAGKRKEVPSAPPSRRESTLDDISDSSARVNSACTSPTSENGVDAKDAGAVKAGKTTGILGLAASDVGSLMGGTS